MFAAVREGQEIAFRMLKPGVNGQDVHHAILKYFEQEGFQTGELNGRMQGFFHGTGHGVGLEIHEPPRIGPRKDILKAGMVVLDVAVPTGFESVRESIEEAVAGEPRMKRFDVAGRKVIFYIEDMDPGDSVSFSFDARALYPVKAKGVASQAYSYYKPEWRGETLGGEMEVR